MALAVSPRQIPTNDFIAEATRVTRQTRAVTLGAYLGPELGKAKLHPLERPDEYHGGAQLLSAGHKLLLGVSTRREREGWSTIYNRYHKLSDRQTVDPSFTDGDPQERRLVFEANVGEGFEALSVPNDPEAVSEIEDSLDPDTSVLLPLGDVDTFLKDKMCEVRQRDPEFTPWRGILRLPLDPPIDFEALLSWMHTYEPSDPLEAAGVLLVSTIIELGTKIVSGFGEDRMPPKNKMASLETMAVSLTEGMDFAPLRVGTWVLRHYHTADDPIVLLALRVALEAVAEAGDPLGYRHFHMFNGFRDPEHMAFHRSMITREALTTFRLTAHIT